MAEVIKVDDQPIAASFFGEGSWLTDFVTPEASDVQELFKYLTRGLTDPTHKIAACHKWVVNKVKYIPFVRAKLILDGQSSVQEDFWAMPSLTIQTGIGNCATKSFLLASLLRNEFSPGQVFCTLGNLYNGDPGGHAWVSLRLPQGEQIIETTVPGAHVMVPAATARRYEAVHYFNDRTVYAVEGRTQMEPMAACYSTWLEDYLNWAYIEGQKGVS